MSVQTKSESPLKAAVSVASMCRQLRMSAASSIGTSSEARSMLRCAWPRTVAPTSRRRWSRTTCGPGKSGVGDERRIRHFLRTPADRHEDRKARSQGESRRTLGGAPFAWPDGGHDGAGRRGFGGLLSHGIGGQDEANVLRASFPAPEAFGSWLMSVWGLAGDRMESVNVCVIGGRMRRESRTKVV